MKCVHELVGGRAGIHVHVVDYTIHRFLSCPLIFARVCLVVSGRAWLCFGVEYYDCVYVHSHAGTRNVSAQVLV